MSISTKTRNTSSINLIRESARDFALQYIKPYVMDWDENQHFPKEVLQKAGEYGFMGILVPEEYGGSGLGYHEYVAIIDEISRVVIQYSGYYTNSTRSLSQNDDVYENEIQPKIRN